MTSERQREGKEESRAPVWLVCAGLAVGTLAVYAQVRGFSFVAWDDHLFFDENPFVRGLSWENIAWAVEIHGPGQWHPLAWWVHQLNYEFFGLEAGGHHLVNVLLHMAASVALLFAFWRLTGRFWPSALVAALFAWHPLSVASVAWASHLRDSLSTLFWALAMWAYADYASQGGRRRYFLVLGFFALGLMSKPTLITFPCVLLLLDYWPLKRIAGLGEIRRVLVEKVPFFVLAGVSAWLCFLCQSGEGAVVSLESYSVGVRMANAVQSYVLHLWNIAWPLNLSHVYPFPDSFGVVRVAAAVVVLFGVTAIAVRYRRRHGYLLVGWLWYLGTLAPVIGLLKLGAPTSMADHHGYVPRLGIYLLIAWALAELLGRRPESRRAVAAGVAVVLLILMPMSWKQAGVWRNDLVLNRHALDVTKNNFIASSALGDALQRLGRHDEAVAHYAEAVRIQPGYAEAHFNWGVALQASGRLQEAIPHYAEALRIRPDYAEARNNWGNVLQRLGRHEEAIAHYEEALRIRPDNAATHNNWGSALQVLGRPEEALIHYEEALRIQPTYAEARNNWGMALQALGRLEEAIAQYEGAVKLQPMNAAAQYNWGNALQMLGEYQEALLRYEEAVRIQPDFAESHGTLALMLASSKSDDLRDGERALHHAIRYVELAGENNPDAISVLAAAYAEQGKFEEAVSWQERALQLAEDEAHRERLELYRGGVPYRRPEGNTGE